MDRLVLLENFLVKDLDDRKYYRSLNEASKKLLTRNMVDRLFKTVKEKALKVDYFGLEKTNGDITKFKKYRDVENCIQILHRMYLGDPKESPTEILTLVNTLNSLKKNKNEFAKAFADKNEIAIMLYVNISAVLIAATANLIATTLDYIKSPMGDYKAIFKDECEHKFKCKIYFESLKKYLSLEQTGDLRSLINNNKVNESFGFNLDEDNSHEHYLTEFVHIVFGVIVGIWLAVVLLREITFLFYFERKKISNDLLELSYFLELHAQTIDTSKSEHNRQVYNNQMKMVEKLKRWSEKIAPESEKASKQSVEEIKKSDESTSDIKNQQQEEEQNNNDLSQNSGSDNGDILL